MSAIIWVFEQILDKKPGYLEYFELIDGGASLSIVPEEIRNDKYRKRELERRAVMRNPENFSLINPYDYKGEFFLVDVVRQHPELFKDFPDDLKTTSVCAYAVLQRSELLNLVPENLLTYEFFRYVVERNALFLKHVPEGFIDREMCMVAIHSDENREKALSVIPPALIDREMCMEAVKNSVESLVYVPKSILNHDMVMDAIGNCEFSFDLVPKKFLSDELIRKVLQNNPCTLRSLPGSLATDEYALLALRADYRAFSVFPEYMKTESVLKEAVRLYSDAIKRGEIRITDVPLSTLRGVIFLTLDVDDETKETIYQQILEQTKKG